MKTSLSNSKVWQLLEELKDKQGVTEIAINQPQKIFVEKDGRFVQLDLKFTKQDLTDFIQDVAVYNNKEISDKNPLLDGVLPGGSRVNIVHPPLVPEYPVISIRPFNLKILHFDESPDLFELSPYWIEFLKAAAKAKVNILVSGGTGTGKTTFLNMLLGEVSSSERIITIEDTRELQIDVPNIINMEIRDTLNTKVTARDLVKNSLRMRPDRIILGEIRGPEVFDLLQAMNTGHSGSMSSIHANSASECLTRLTSLFMLAGLDIPLRVARAQIGTAIQFIIGLSKTKEGKRIVSEILEITGLENETLLSQKIAENRKGKLCFTGITPSCMKILEQGGLPLDYFLNAK